MKQAVSTLRKATLKSYKEFKLIKCSISDIGSCFFPCLCFACWHTNLEILLKTASEIKVLKNNLKLEHVP